jgi:S-DNA-T family DNA segregation ATPase FtsK/SpoIIIE
MTDAQDMINSLGTVGRQPAVIDMHGSGVVSLLGTPEVTRSLARALLLQVAVLHAPDDVQIAARTGGAEEWEWLKWLPHTFEPEAVGDAGVVPLVAAGLDGIADFLEAELDRRQKLLSSRRASLGRELPTQRRLLVVLDGYDPAAEWARSALVKALLASSGPELGVTVVCLAERDNQQPTRVDVRAQLDESGRLVVDCGPAVAPMTVQDATPDQPDPELAELISRALAPLTLSEERDQLLARDVSLRSILGADLEVADIMARWVTADDEAMLRLPVGIDGDGQPVELDLKESAQGGMGPHGLVVGATGSGKSELLRTLVTGLALTHPPELLSFVLVDFKGGATFAQHTDLPHVAGVITNLADDLALVDRVQAALRGEQQRRQQILKDAGHVDSVREYQMRRAAGHTDVHGEPLQPLPYLLVIVDEFGELLSARPDFIDLFVQIGRVGRSLGIHLLLATQRLEEGRLRGLESHLSYRICLRTFTALESRTAIGTTDAYALPSIPGSAYLKVDESLYTRFRVAHISGPFVSAAERAAGLTSPTVEITGYELRRAPDPEAAEAAAKAPVVLAGQTEMQVAIERLAWVGQAVHQVWLPPLPSAIPLDMLTGPVTAQAGRGCLAAGSSRPGQLTFLVGVIDLPARQQQQPLAFDFAGAHGHLAIVGAPQTGRSTVLRTVMLSAMLSHNPDEAQFYCIDFGGGTAHAFSRAPHVGTVAGRTDGPRIRRMLADIHHLVGTREKLFRELGIDSVAGFRVLRDTGRLPAASRGADVFLVIDNWGALRAEVDVADAYVLDIASRGAGVGVHLILTANRWADIRMNLRDSINARLELRLGDPAESEVSRQLSRQLPANVAGRGLVAPGVYFQAALPRLDSADSVAGLREAQADILDKIVAAWTGEATPSIRILPERITVAELPALSADSPAGVPVGIGELDLDTVSVDLTGTDPHLLIFGDVGSGKTALLRTWVRGLARRYPAASARVIIIDYRRALLGVVAPEHLAGYAGDAATARSHIEQIAGVLDQRRPPAGVTPRQLRTRSWWRGPEIYLVVDDYDLVSGGPQAPLGLLADYIPQAREIGLHLVIARRTGGAGRAMMSDPLLTRIRDLGTFGLLLSGDPREGTLVGDQHAIRQPPGRGLLTSRNQRPALLQLAIDEDHDDNAQSGAGAVPAVAAAL